MLADYDLETKIVYLQYYRMSRLKYDLDLASGGQLNQRPVLYWKSSHIILLEINRIESSGEKFHDNEFTPVCLDKCLPFCCLVSESNWSSN